MFPSKFCKIWTVGAPYKIRKVEQTSSRVSQSPPCFLVTKYNSTQPNLGYFFSGALLCLERIEPPV